MVFSRFHRRLSETSKIQLIMRLPLNATARMSAAAVPKFLSLSHFV